MKKTITSLLLLATVTLGAWAQSVSVKWELGNISNLAAVSTTGDEAYTSLLTTTYTQGSNIGNVTALTASNAAEGYTAVTYEPPFASYTPTTRVNGATAGHDISFGIKPAAGHKLKVTRVSFDCARVGTDGGGVDATLKPAGGTAVALAPVEIKRNKIDANNSTGFAHNEFPIADLVVGEAGMTLVLSIYQLNGTDNENPKSMAFRNVVIEGVMDEEVFTASHYLADFSCTAKTGTDEPAPLNLYNLVKDLKNGQNTRFTTKLYGHPTNFETPLQTNLAEGFAATTNYSEANNTATVSITKNGNSEFSFSVSFSVTNRQPKGQPVALRRGLMALHKDGGNLVSWRARKTDPRNYKFKLWRGNSPTEQKTKVNGGNFIMGRTNFLDANGAAGAYYRLEVFNEQGEIIEQEVSKPTWNGQVSYVTLQGGAPTDPTSAGATYTPNDASLCDMDGDGEYDIVVKWAPSNEKDAASSGTTSPAFYACYKFDGTRLWMLHTGNSMFNSAHTTPFVAWDLDGDGFGEFMVKTGPGAVDGEGNYVIMPGDDPTRSWKSGNGKQVEGPEYITVFDGTTGAELKTIKYHTAYGDVTTGFWGDSKQNRSERYLASIAWLDGEDANPSAIFARGYYSGCRIGAYDWDGANLTLRWLHSGTARNAGTVTYANGTVKQMNTSVYGEGAHWVSVGDVTGDGRQEIHYGSGALKPDGTTLYRTGFEHGDALHLGDFIPSRPGQEFFMVLEHKPYGANLRDAATGEVLWRTTAGSDTGRGIMAHFDPEAENAYWQSSADNGLYDTSRNVILAECTHGGGASLNNRIYWNDNLADDYYDKGVLETWNPSYGGFNRMQVNGGNYVYGNENNGSKRNPCVMGDLWGDWREEIVTWQLSGNNYQLVINATNYETPYTFPHLMDDFAYRAQLVTQNCGYNQPPHVSYDPRTEKTITAQTFEVDPGETATERYWGSLYTTYPIIIPADVKAWAVGNRVETNDVDTIKVTLLEAGKVVPADRAIIFNSANPAPRFVPTAKPSYTTVNTAYAKGFYCDSLVADPTAVRMAYEFRNGSRGVGFYRTHGEKMIAGGQAYALYGNNSQPGRESYVLGQQLNDIERIALGIVSVNAESNESEAEPVYNMQGQRLGHAPARGIYIIGGRKVVK
ncbi:MAG: hypothetical protein J5971_03600 [Prevotella sp.]|nr:hypothetical protein [Prevotella sp.]